MPKLCSIQIGCPCRRCCITVNVCTIFIIPCVPEVVSLYVMMAWKVVLSFIGQISDDQNTDGEWLTPSHFILPCFSTFTGPVIWWDAMCLIVALSVAVLKLPPSPPSDRWSRRYWRNSIVSVSFHIALSLSVGKAMIVVIWVHRTVMAMAAAKSFRRW